MRRRSATISLMVDTSPVPEETVGMLSDLEWGMAAFASGHTSMMVTSSRTRAASSRLELISVPPGCLSNITAVMSDGQGWRHTMLEPDLDGSIHTPPVTMPEALHNPSWVGSWRTILTR